MGREVLNDVGGVILLERGKIFVFVSFGEVVGDIFVRGSKMVLFDFDKWLV